MQNRLVQTEFEINAFNIVVTFLKKKTLEGFKKYYR